ncbi:hypothetical protein BH23GEM9_BH23GEM9_18680 [soil metagenome]
MKSISKWKDEARRFEQQEQWEKAINAYLQVLQVSGAGEAEIELPLYNRIGDLYVRLGRPQEAVTFYEQAADRYADVGLYNSAIALCNKALRYRPERLELLRKLGHYSVQQGFLTDATAYYTTYAEKKFTAGEQEEALSALEEFAGASNEPEVRELLGRRLLTFGFADRAVRELQKARWLRAKAGESAAAAALLEEIRQIDPSVALLEESQPLPGDETGAAEGDAADTARQDEVADPQDGDGADDGRLEGFEGTAVEHSDAVLYDRDGGIEMHDLERLHAEDEDGVSLPAPGLHGLEPTALDFGRAAAELDDDLQDTGIRREESLFDEGGFDTADYEEPESAGLPAVDDDVDFEDLDDYDESSPLPLLEADPGPLADEGPVAQYDADADLDDETGDGPLPPLTPAVPLPPPVTKPVPPAPTSAATDDRAYIDLADLLAGEAVEETTRFRVNELAPTGDEDRDFADLLSQFKAKLSEHLPPEDAAAHYDLGLAFREMGLFDEAIMEFQIAARESSMRLKIFEELGQCFLEKKQYNIAEKVLRRALELPHGDELELLGVYYHLGRACESLGRPDQARDAYERVLGMDINFQDVTERLARL